ncbi:MAG: LON peptidase substrate-binding domain-containing protein, partial [Deltaproteobacteria bacterium]|nr:LON peptidase substrate-binding domain-containing protein [Deltaproteobacteria bacterium]
MITVPKMFGRADNEPPRMVLPLLPLRDIVVFPQMVAPLFVGRKKSVSALAEAMKKDKRVFLATQKKASVDTPEESDISEMGTVGKVLQLLKLPDGTVKALVEGETRGKIIQFIRQEEFFKVEIEAVVETPLSETAQLALTRALHEAFEDYAKINKNISKDLVANILSITDPSKLSDTMAAHFSFRLPDKQRLLESVVLEDRLSLLLSLIRMEIEVFEMDKRIKERVKEQMEKTQRNYYLNEQMRAIKKEMGSEDDSQEELQELEKEIESKQMSEEATEKVRREFRKLKLMAPMSAEATVVRNYIEWLIGLPWYEKSEVCKDIGEAEKILDEDHYGLEKPKERIIE